MQMLMKSNLLVSLPRLGGGWLANMNINSNSNIPKETTCNSQNNNHAVGMKSGMSSPNRPVFRSVLACFNVHRNHH
jgi:hypothetical protein